MGASAERIVKGKCLPTIDEEGEDLSSDDDVNGETVAKGEGSGLLAPVSWVLVPGCWFMAPRSWPLASSWLLAPGSWLHAPGS